MKERPILFQGGMARAILAGTKTQTRRAVKPQPEKIHNGEPYWYVGGYRVWRHRAISDPLRMGGKELVCPYGQPGDRLWVRESFWGCDLPGYGDQPCVVYDDEWEGKEYRPAEARPWARRFGRIPSIHMPRDCSRITLEITEVRVERLQSISETDAQAEGITEFIGGWWCEHDDAEQIAGMTPPEGYRHLWERINGAGSWAANPWVWVVEFSRAAAATGEKRG